jgi:hypothetical protein
MTKNNVDQPVKEGSLRKQKFYIRFNKKAIF